MHSKLIEEDQAVRDVPKDVFCYARPDLWKPQIWSIFDDVLDQGVIDEFLQYPPEEFDEDLFWLDEIVLETKNRFISMKKLAGERLAHQYRALRAAHGTRTSNIESFYRSGLHRLCSDEMDQIASDLLVRPDHPSTTQKLLNDAICEVNAKGTGGRDGFLYLCTDERELIDRAGHYLIYGSEYLYNLAIRAMDTWSAQRFLKSIGIPTMIVCDIPFADIPTYQQEYFATKCIERMFCDLLGQSISFGHSPAIILQQDLLPEHIVGHYHPSLISDPFNRHFPYNFEASS
ncbi:hypothetical protein [Pseudovibrio sp. Alg231-02]|uniref:hypothetical protein n=1 Tax=Pseudovibrio sp. Alg231-02 TaxID=1922223 RepID=UPI000D552A8C|nr:hypothetical protein [Pseudovibrio sp. Alg231-02]